MSRVKGLHDLDFMLWNKIVKLYREDPITHAYLVYDLMYELDKTEVYFVLDDDQVVGYVLIWAGLRRLGIHLWGNVKSLIEKIPFTEASVIQLYDASFLNSVITFLRGRSRAEVRYFVDMSVDENRFRPCRPEGAVRLRAGEDVHVRALMKIKRAQGRALDECSIRELMERWRYYGVFKEDALVSIACAYLRLPEIWIIGDVFTHPEHRGRGYAKIVTSAITRDAVVSGARALLHVRESNVPAIKVYKALGYEVLRKRPWIFMNEEV